MEGRLLEPRTNIASSSCLPPPVSPSHFSVSACGDLKRCRLHTDDAAAHPLLPRLSEIVSPACIHSFLRYSLIDDIWTTILNFLDLNSIIRLGMVNRAFRRLVMERFKWRIACIRDFSVSFDDRPKFSWRDLYLSAISKMHSYSFQKSHQHLDWLRVGSFRVESGDVLVSSNLSELELEASESSVATSNSVDSSTICLSNVTEGAWIADLHLVRCTLCDQSLCQGTMQMLEARYWELFLHEEYIKGEWKFEKIVQQLVYPSPPRAAMAAIIDVKHLESENMQELLDFETWTYPEDVYLPSTICNRFAAAACTNMAPENDGKLVIKLYTMRATVTKQAPIVAIRITQEIEPGSEDKND